MTMIATQPFGRTGRNSTRSIFGAFALINATQDDADRTLKLLLEYGINHIDTAANYGDSELRELVANQEMTTIFPV
jgi:aryl-alcohol dehydrogenase-like predicted oxidoreductase